MAESTEHLDCETPPHFARSCICVALYWTVVAGAIVAWSLGWSPAVWVTLVAAAWSLRLVPKTPPVGCDWDGVVELTGTIAFGVFFVSIIIGAIFPDQGWIPMVGIVSFFGVCGSLCWGTLRADIRHLREMRRSNTGAA